MISKTQCKREDKYTDFKRKVYNFNQIRIFCLMSSLSL